MRASDGMVICCLIAEHIWQVTTNRGAPWRRFNQVFVNTLGGYSHFLTRCSWWVDCYLTGIFSWVTDEWLGYLALCFQGFRVLEQPEQTKDMTREDFMEHHRAWCCSTTPEKAICGVSRIWVFSLARRKGIATRMLDTVRLGNYYSLGSANLLLIC